MEENATIQLFGCEDFDDDYPEKVYDDKEEEFYVIHQLKEDKEITDIIYVRDWDILCNYLLSKNLYRATTAGDERLMPLPEKLTLEHIERCKHNIIVRACIDTTEDVFGCRPEPKYYEITAVYFRDGLLKRITPTEE